MIYYVSPNKTTEQNFNDLLDSMAQSLIHGYRWMPVKLSSNSIKVSGCFLEQEIVPSLLSSGWLQEKNKEGTFKIKLKSIV